MSIVKLYECSFCHNTWTLEEGFRLDTKQCTGCQKYDDDKPKRKKEEKQRKKFTSLNIDFPYVP